MTRAEQGAPFARNAPRRVPTLAGTEPAGIEPAGIEAAGAPVGEERAPAGIEAGDERVGGTEAGGGRRPAGAEAGGGGGRWGAEAGGGRRPAGAPVGEERAPGIAGDDRVGGDRAGGADTGEDRDRRGQKPTRTAVGEERNGSGGTSATRLAVSKPRANLNRRNPGFQVPPIVP